MLDKQNVTLDGTQQRIYEELVDRHPDLGKMFQGAVEASQHPSLTNHLPMAALSARELMDKIPKYLAVPEKERDGEHFHLGREVESLHRSWEDTKEHSSAFDGEEETWDGEIDDELARLLDETGEVFEKRAQKGSFRRRLFLEWWESEDPSVTPSPPHAQENEWKEWHELLEYFNAVLHGRETGQEEFDRQFRRLEDLLYSHLCTAPTELHQELDDLIAAAEAND